MTADDFFVIDDRGTVTKLDQKTSQEVQKHWEDFFASMFIPDGTTKQKPTPPGKDPLNLTNLEPVKAKWWKNLYFRKDGKYGAGDGIWGDEVTAKYIAERSAAEIMATAGTPIVFLVEGKLKLDATTFSHHIQIPWNKQ